MEEIPWEILNDSQKIAFIRENYNGIIDQENIDSISDEIVNGRLPNGRTLDEVNFTPEVSTLIDKYANVKNLNIDVLIEISSTLDYESVINLCVSNKQFTGICESVFFWTKFISKKGCGNSIIDKTLDELKAFARYIYVYDRENLAPIISEHIDNEQYDVVASLILCLGNYRKLYNYSRHKLIKKRQFELLLNELSQIDENDFTGS